MASIQSMGIHTALSSFLIALLLVAGILIVTAPLRWVFNTLDLSTKARNVIIQFMVLVLLVWWGRSIQQASPHPAIVAPPMMEQEVTPSIYLPLVMQ